MICWKRRSSAPSFSMYLRYSSSVVAPMHWISPRARAGLSTLLASMAPSAPPAPTTGAYFCVLFFFYFFFFFFLPPPLFFFFILFFNALLELAAVLGAGD